MAKHSDETVIRGLTGVRRRMLTEGALKVVGT